MTSDYTKTMGAMFHGLAPCPTFKLFTCPPAYFDVFLSSHLITTFTAVLLVAG